MTCSYNSPLFKDILKKVDGNNDLAIQLYNLYFMESSKNKGATSFAFSKEDIENWLKDGDIIWQVSQRILDQDFSAPQKETSKKLSKLSSSVTRRDVGGKHDYYKDGKKLTGTTGFIHSKRGISYFEDNTLGFDKDALKREKMKEFSSSNPKATPAETKAKEKEIDDEIAFYSVIADAGSAAHAFMQFVITDNPEDISLALGRLNDKEKAAIAPIQDILFKIGQDYRKQILESYVTENIQFLSELRIGTTKLTEQGENVLEEKGIGGTTDIIVLRQDGSVDIYDWKFSTKNVGRWDKGKMSSNVHQQNIYKGILMAEGITVNNANLIPFQIDVAPDGSITSINNTGNIISANSATVLDKIYGIIKVADGAKNKTVIKNGNTISEISSKLLGLVQRSTSTVAVTDAEAIAFGNKVTKSVLWIMDKRFEVKDDEGNINLEEVKAYLLRKKNLSSDLAENFLNAVQYIKNEKVRGEEAKITNKIEITALAHRYLNDFITDGKGKIEYFWDLKKVEGTNKIIATNNRTGNREILDFTPDELGAKTKMAMGKSIAGNLTDDTQAKIRGIKHNNSTGAQHLLSTMLFVMQNHGEMMQGAKIERVIAVGNGYKSVSSTVRDIVNDINILADLDDTLYDYDENGKKKKGTLKEFISGKNDPSKYQLNPLKALIQYYESEMIKVSKAYFENIKEVDRKATWQSLIKRDEATKDVLIELEQNMVNRQKYLLGQGNPAQQDFNIQTELSYISQILLGIKGLRLGMEDDLSTYGSFPMFGESQLFTRPDNIDKSSIAAIVDLYGEAEANIRQKMNDMAGDVRESLIPLIQEKQGLGSNRLTGWTRELYKNMFRFRKENGKWVNTYELRNPANEGKYLSNMPDFQKPLSQKEEKFIKDFVRIIGSERNHKKDFDSDERGFEIPLVRASAHSAFMQKWESKDKTASSGIKEYWNEMSDSFTNLEGVLSNDQEYLNKREKMIEIGDLFGYGEKESNRAKLLEENENQFEDDLELVLYQYMHHSFKKTEFNKVLPYVHATRNILLMNRLGFLNDNPKILELIDSELRTKFFGRGMKDEENDRLMKIVGPVQSFAANSLLLFSPITSTVNVLANMWTTISAIGGVGSDRLDYKHFMKAATFVFSHAHQNYNSVSFINQMIEQFGIQQMEGHAMLGKMTEAHKGVFKNLQSYGHFMNSYPDVLFRTSLFIAEMLKEGSLKIDGNGISESSALKIGKDDKLSYDPSKDDRFSIYLNQPSQSNTLEYKKQEALYKYYQNLLSQEHKGVDENGKLLKPYHRKDIHSKIKFADMIYAETSASNKNLFEKTAIGSMMMMFKRYALAKVELYFQTYKIDTSQGYNRRVKKVDENGKEVYTYEWAGRPMEGVFWSMGKMIKDTYHYRNPVKAWNEQEDFRQRNLMQAGIDAFLYALLTALAGLMAGGLKEDESGGSAMLSKLMRNSARDMFILNVLNNTTKSTNMVAMTFANNVVNGMVSDITHPSNLFSETLDNVGLYRNAAEIYNYMD